MLTTFFLKYFVSDITSSLEVRQISKFHTVWKPDGFPYWTLDQGSIYSRRDHCQSEYDFKHSEPEICNFYVQKIKIISFMYTTELFYYDFHHNLQFFRLKNLIAIFTLNGFFF